jgi:ABC-2 type transport system permease protein
LIGAAGRPYNTLIVMLAALPKYLKIYRVSLTERLVYRADFFLGTILRFLPTVTTILLWEAIYEGSHKDELGGFSRSQMIAYLLLVHISRMFSSMPGLAYGIARDIRDGSLKKYLLQPIDMIAYLVSYRGAHKTAYIATTALPYALLFFLFRDYFPPFPDALTTAGALTLAGYVVSLLLAFVVGFFFEASLGMMGFWFLEVTSFLYIVGAVNFFVSGQMLPPDFLPEPWAGLLKALPFKYLAYFPAMVFLGKVQGWDLAYGLLAEAGWALFFIVLARLLYRFGLRRYSAFGG